MQVRTAGEGPAACPQAVAESELGLGILAIGLGYFHHIWLLYLRRVVVWGNGMGLNWLQDGT